MVTIEIKQSDRISLGKGVYQIAFERLYAMKGYPTPCFFQNLKITGDIIEKLESSRIVSVDPDFTVYFESVELSSVLLIPKFGFDIDKLVLILSDLLQKLSDKSES